MIAIWMAYTLVSGILIALICWILERIARGTRLPTRGIWAGGMMVMLVLPAAAREAPAPPNDSPAAAAGAPARAILEDGGRSPSPGQAASFGGAISRALAALDARVAAAAGGLAHWDRPLLLMWALTAAFLAGVVAHAALEGQRLRQGLQSGEIAGTSVLLTEGVGPSAVGIGGPAILIPRWALDLEEDLLTLILRHEREHLARRDPLLLLAALFTVVLVPWHLPLWWSRKRLRLAVEVDCDSRVLRAHPDVRRYAQLLLLTAQRAPSTPWVSLPVATVVAPLRPLASHLARRISAMTQPRTPHVLLRAVPLALGAAAILSLVLALPTPQRAQAQGAATPSRAIVKLTEVGTIDATDPMSIVVYTTGGGRVGIGTNPPVAITDTLRLVNRLPAMTADVTDGDLHIEIRSPGAIRVGGPVTGGRAREVSATGRHIVLLKGGVGIQTRQ